MRTRPTKERAESRVVSRYHKLHEPLIALIQSLEDLLPAGMQLDDTIEFNTENDMLSVTYKARPISLVVRNKDQTIVVQVVPSDTDKKN